MRSIRFASPLCVLLAGAGCDLQSALCQANRCDPAESCSTFQCSSFRIDTDRYEIRCGVTTDAGQPRCQCTKNGQVEREIAPGWNDDHGCSEQMQHANTACGWSMSTCTI